MEDKEQWEEEFDKVWSGYNPEEDSKGLDYRLKQLFKEQIEKAEERGAERFAKHLIPVVEDEHDLNLARYVSESLKNFKKSDYGKEK